MAGQFIGGLDVVQAEAVGDHGPEVDPAPDNGGVLDKTDVVITNVGSAVFQIILLDLVFSIDSILTAVGMTEHLPIMVVAVLVSITVMLLAADGFGVHVPKGYIYGALAFSAGVEVLTMWSRTRSVKRAKASEETRHQGLMAARRDQPERDPV